MKNMPKAIWQVQPDYAAWEAWEKLAQDEKLLYEIMEPIPDVRLLREDGTRADYLHCGHVNALHGAFIDVSSPIQSHLGNNGFFPQFCLFRIVLTQVFCQFINQII